MENRTWIEIDIKKIRENILKIKKMTQTKFLASVKCDMYGMGLDGIAPHIDDIVDFYGVACLEEAIKLKELKIKKPILIMGSVLPGDIEECIQNEIRITLCNDEILNKIIKTSEKYQKKAIVHIKVDTGMGRIGLREGEIDQFFEKISKVKCIEIEGIFSHFATAEEKEKGYAKHQLMIFERIIKRIEKNVKIPLRHIANSAAILNLPESYKNFEMVRIGLLILGVFPSKHLIDKYGFECALKCFTRVNFLKYVEKGTPLSYGLSFTTKRKSKVATISIGYGDGLRRFLSNKFYLKWEGYKVKIIGNICMDQTLLDVTGRNVQIGDTIQVFGENHEIEEMAEIGKTVPQEILCGFGSKRVKKVYKYGEKN